MGLFKKYRNKSLIGHKFIFTQFKIVFKDWLSTRFLNEETEEVTHKDSSFKISTS